jgi:hypothetical protein
MAKMFTLDLQALVNSSKTDALAAMSAINLSEERARAIDYFLGHMDGDMPAEPGRSEAVSTDVSDVIEGLMPELMDTLAGSDEVVNFEPAAERRSAGAGAGAGAARNQPRESCVHAAESRFHGDVFLHQGRAALQGRHRQGVVGGARGRAARNLLRPDGRSIRRSGAGRGRIGITVTVLDCTPRRLCYASSRGSSLPARIRGRGHCEVAHPTDSNVHRPSAKAREPARIPRAVTVRQSPNLPNPINAGRPVQSSPQK